MLASKNQHKGWRNAISKLALASALSVGLFAGMSVVFADDRNVLAFLNDEAVDAEKLAAETGITQWRASLIIAQRNAFGKFESMDQVDAVWGVGPSTMDQLREALGERNSGGGDDGDDAGDDGDGDDGASGGEGNGVDGSGKPTVPADPAQLDQLAFANAMLKYVFEQNFLAWDNYPGLEGHREPTSGWGAGLARARDLRLDGVRYQSWGTSFFSPDAASYIHANLYPMDLFKQKIVDTGKPVSFPTNTVVVKTIFSEYTEPGMKTVEASICNSTRSGCNDSKRHLRPGSMHTHTMGLLQVDISSKQYPEWTWATFVFSPDGDPEHFNLVPHLQDGTYVQTNYDQRYYGPVDNPRSSCQACHQAAQFPPISIGLAVASATHHSRHPGPWSTARGQGIRVDFMWEVSQSLSQYEREHPDEILVLNEPDLDDDDTGTADADSEDDKVLDFVNDRALTAEKLAAEANIDLRRAKLITDRRDNVGRFNEIGDIDDIAGIGAGTLRSLRAAANRSARGFVDELSGIGSGNGGN